MEGSGVCILGEREVKREVHPLKDRGNCNSFLQTMFCQRDYLETIAFHECLRLLLHCQMFQHKLLVLLNVDVQNAGATMSVCKAEFPKCYNCEEIMWWCSRI